MMFKHAVRLFHIHGQRMCRSMVVPGNFRDKLVEGSDNLRTLEIARRYFEMTGQTLTGNDVINKEILTDAIANPHEYEHLMWYDNGDTVRFSDMSYDKQLEIIKSLG